MEKLLDGWDMIAVGDTPGVLPLPENTSRIGLWPGLAAALEQTPVAPHRWDTSFLRVTTGPGTLKPVRGDERQGDSYFYRLALPLALEELALRVLSRCRRANDLKVVRPA
jgi:hypothetical protein